MVLDLDDFRGLVAVRDTLTSDGSFLILHALKLILAPHTAHNAIIVLTKTTAPAFAAMLRRSGMDMLALVDQGRLVVIDVLRQLSVLDSSASCAPAFLNLEDIQLKMVRGAASLKQGHPIHIIFDDLTALHIAAAGSSSPNDWSLFLRSSLSLCVGASTTAPPPSLLVLVHGDIDDDSAWIKLIEHRATVVIDVEPLDSGMSSEITGKMTILHRDLPPLLADATTEKEYEIGCIQVYYKVLESGGVKFIESMPRKIM